jgi:prophage regulatory protein
MLLRFPQLKSKGIPWTRMHLDRLERAGSFPKRVHLGSNTVGWVEDEIDAHVAAKVAARDAE